MILLGQLRLLFLFLISNANYFLPLPSNTKQIEKYTVLLYLCLLSSSNSLAREQTLIPVQCKTKQNKTPFHFSNPFSTVCFFKVYLYCSLESGKERERDLETWIRENH